MRLHDAITIRNPALLTEEVHYNRLSAALGRRAAEVRRTALQKTAPYIFPPKKPTVGLQMEKLTGRSSFTGQSLQSRHLHLPVQMPACTNMVLEGGKCCTCLS